ncbi:hypothetical protein [Cryobacterium psychrophilum]|uniref:Uncharacterized protein n=1 Tax=Cryobacterium psychrophilum TaxID=41988 RepID=A0A4Y8KQJ8_9MICO|nr:hypothetical protein [Cryobacterium psychrophilum]TFD80031.1 hypothetical protein E3T53_06425 [Cryobacterium psychrophilum]
MFKFHWRNKKSEQPRPTRRAVGDNSGFTDLEGDFESERRRAESSEASHPKPDKHDDDPHLPGGWSAFTHP